MPIITREKIENEYRAAVRNKYNIEKNGSYSHYLDNPTQANLRDICWEIFSKKEKSDDLIVYRSFFRYDFNKNEEDVSIKYTDKFRKVRDFYLGKKKTAKTNTIDFAAILVDFEPRPFKKFEEKFGFLDNNNIHNENVEGSGESIKSPYVRQPFFTKELSLNEDSIEIKQENTIEEQNAIEEESLLEEEILNEMRTSDIREEFINQENFKKDLNDSVVSRINKKTFSKRLLKISKKTMIATVIIFSLIGLTIYFAFFKNHCMQWSDDHYEIVDCSSNSNNGNLNAIIPIEKDLLDFRKINACDTTKCFLTNGEAFVWYGKTGTGIDFFNDNGNGKHPVTKKALRPISQYIFAKYLRGKSCK